MPPPCQGLRVVDLTRSFTGALATMLLADAGAEVVKIEPPEGDPSREHYAALMWHRGKRSVVLDLKTEEGRTDAQRLAGAADVVIAGFRPGITARLGMDYDGLAARNPGLIYADVTGFGPTGPYANVRAYEGIVNAVAGRMDVHHATAGHDRPAYPSQLLTSYGAALNTVQAILAALFVRERCGQGQRVETSLLRATNNYDLSYFLGWQLYRRGEFDGPFRYNGGGVPPYMTGRSKDGHWMQFGNLTPQTLFNFLHQLGLEWTLSDERFANQPVFANVDDLRELQRLCLAALLEKDLDEWMRIFMENDVAAEPFRTTQEGMRHSQALHNRNVIDLSDPGVGPTKQLGVLAKFGSTPMEAGGPAPAVGADTAAVLAGLDGAAPPEPRSILTPPSAPLEGLQVLEFASYIAGPYATALLADLGARVIKVEPIGGDPFRAMGIASLGAGRCNGSKESIALDLKSPEGQEIVHSLAASTDIIIHNYRPGVPERLGIGYETLKAIRPELVYVYVNGYGRGGPGAHRPSTHPIPGAGLGGALMQMGEGMPPVCSTIPELREIARKFFRANELNPDPNTSVVVASASLLGLYARRRFGHGQEVFVDMFGANAWANADDFIAYEGKPPRPTLDRDLYGLGPTWRLYEAAEGWVFLGLAVQPEWERFCEMAGRPDLAADPRFATPDARTANAAALAEALAGLFATRPADEWEALLATEGLGCVRADSAPVHEFIARDEHVAANGLRVPAYSANFGEYERYGPLTAFSENKLELRGFPLAGEQADAILAELGYDPAAVEALRAKGVVWSETPAPLAAVTA